MERGRPGFWTDLTHPEWIYLRWSCSVFQMWLVYMRKVDLVGALVGWWVGGGGGVSCVDSVPTECVGAQTLCQLWLSAGGRRGA